MKKNNAAEPASVPVAPAIAISTTPSSAGSAFDSMDGAMTLQQWRQNPALRAQLLQALETPIIRMAVKTLFMTFVPSGPFSIEAGTTSDALRDSLAFRYVHRAGFFGFPRALFNLAKGKIAEKQGDGSWGELVDDEETPNRQQK